MKIKACLIVLVAAVSSLLFSCEKKSGSVSGNDTLTTRDSLRIALDNQDSLLVLMNDITEGISQIKALQNIVSSSDLDAETVNQREALRNDMMMIQKSLRDRQSRLEELERKLAGSSSSNNTLKQAIQNLKKQLAEQETTIETLRTELSNANIRIDQLTTNVDSLNSDLRTVTAEKELVQEAATNAVNELNTCYYAIGSKSELRAHKLIETGFLRKTKIMPDDFQQSYFTSADKRALKVINLHAKNGKVLTSQPSDSYVIEDGENGNKVLRITSPQRFWSISNFLIIQID